MITIQARVQPTRDSDDLCALYSAAHLLLTSGPETRRRGNLFQLRLGNEFPLVLFGRDDQPMAAATLGGPQEHWQVAGTFPGDRYFGDPVKHVKGGVCLVRPLGLSPDGTLSLEDVPVVVLTDEDRHRVVIGIGEQQVAIGLGEQRDATAAVVLSEEVTAFLCKDTLIGFYVSNIVTVDETA
jgi:hypothetical protein